MNKNSSDLRVQLPGSDRKIQKQLFFDRRYGWVFDEWKDPAEEALAGGRGMFCVVPIAMGLFRMAFQSIDCAITTVAKVVESSDQISARTLHAAFVSQCQKFASLTKLSEANVGGAFRHMLSIFE